MNERILGKNVPDRREVPVRFAWAPLTHDRGATLEALELLERFATDFRAGRVFGEIKLRASEQKVAHAVAVTLRYRHWFAYDSLDEQDNPVVIVDPQEYQE